MRFEHGIAKRYRRSIIAAFDAIMELGNDGHRDVAGAIIDSDMLIRVEPVSKLNASGVTGVIDPSETNEKIADSRVSFREALGEIYIAIAKETIDTGGQRGCEGTFVHEGRHAYDFAAVVESFANADVNPLSVFDPTLYELEWEAHRTSGEYMLCVARDEYIEEGINLLIIGNNAEQGCFLNEKGIECRLRDNYGLTLDANPGPRASELLGLRLK